MNSMLYQKQFQPNSAGLRMAQHFPGQFNPQVRVHFDSVRNAPPIIAFLKVYTFHFRCCLNQTSSLLWFDLLMPTLLLEVCSALPWALRCPQMLVVVSCLILDLSMASTVSILPEDLPVPPSDPVARRQP